MKQSKRYLVGLVLALTLSGFAAPVSASPVVIVHPGVDVDQLNVQQVRKIFMGKVVKWDNGDRIRLATMGGGGRSKEFLATYINKTPKQYFTTWKRAVFSGTGHMPASFETEAEMIAFVARTKGAVGFIDQDTEHRGVKVVPVK